MLDRKIEDNGVLEYCRGNDIAMLAYSPLEQGLLTGKVGLDRQFGKGDMRKTNPRFWENNRRRVNAMLEEFRPMTESNKVTLSQLVIAWTLEQPGLSHVLCGARNETHARENAGGGELVLSADEIKTLNEIIVKYKN